MNRRIVKKTYDSYKVEIFMAGNIVEAKNICFQYCNEVGLCVTVSPTTYVFTGGREEGFVVGLINYARFPREKWDVWADAVKLAEKLKAGLAQGSYTIQDPSKSVFVSTRDEDQ